MKELLEAIAKLQGLTTEYRKTLGEKNQESAEVKEKMAKMEKDMDDLDKKIATLQVEANRPEKTGAASESKEEKAEKELKEAKFRKDSFFKFLKAGPAALTPEEMKTMTLADETSLGYLAPPEFWADILKNVVQRSPVRQLASVRTISGRELQRPKRTSTLSASWIGESGMPSEVKKKHGILKFPAHKLGALAEVSPDSLEDISFIEQDIRAEFEEQFAVAEGIAFLTGNAVDKPEGIISNSDISVRTSEVTAKVDFDDLLNIQHDLKVEYWPNSTWAFTSATLKNFRKIKDANNQYIWQPAVAASIPATILDRPYVLMPDMAEIATNAKPVIYGDFRAGYLIVDRRDLAIQIFREKYAPDTGYFGTRRLGGGVQKPEALKILKVK